MGRMVPDASGACDDLGHAGQPSELSADSVGCRALQKRVEYRRALTGGNPAGPADVGFGRNASGQCLGTSAC